MPTIYRNGIEYGGSSGNNYTAGDGIDITNDVISSENSNLINGSATGSVRGVGSAEEDSSYTIGQYALAEGYNTIASGYCSHAEGSKTKASGYSSHAEGGGLDPGSDGSVASGYNSHAEGCSTTASGYYSHSQNNCTKATTRSQTVIGEFNELDTSTNPNQRGYYAFAIGNGTADNARSNALTVNWQGNVNIARGAKYKINGTNLAASDVGAVPTSRTVNSKALSSDISLTASDVGAVPVRSGYGAEIDIKNYTSASNPYVFPSDGMVRLTCNYRQGSYIGVTISNSDGSNAYLFQIGSQGGSNRSLAVPVFKGQKAYRSSNNEPSGATNGASFIPYLT